MKLKSTLPQILQDYFILKSDIHPYETRGASGIHIIQARTNYKKIFILLFWSTVVELFTIISNQHQVNFPI